MCGLWAGLGLAGVSPFMFYRQIERSLLFLFFFFQLILHRLYVYFCGRRVSSFAVWQSDRNKFTNKKKTGLWTQQGWQKRSGSGYVLEIARSFFGIFSSKDKKPSPSEELEESKEVQESKGKGIFFRRWSNRRRLPSLLDRRSQKSRSSLILDPCKSRFNQYWLNRDLQGSFVFHWEYLQRYLSFGKCFLKRY